PAGGAAAGAGGASLCKQPQDKKERGGSHAPTQDIAASRRIRRSAVSGARSRLCEASIVGFLVTKAISEATKAHFEAVKRLSEARNGLWRLQTERWNLRRGPSKLQKRAS